MVEIGQDWRNPPTQNQLLLVRDRHYVEHQGTDGIPNDLALVRTIPGQNVLPEWQ